MTTDFSEKINTIKWIGIITMTIDHVGYYLFPQVIWLRLIGRIAFPCFLYGVILGTKNTSNYPRYILRLLLLGLISMSVTPFRWNVLFLLALFSLSMKYRQYFPLFMLLSLFVEYNIYGFLFGWAIWWLLEKDQPQGIFATIAVQIIHLFSLQTFSLLAVPLFISDRVGRVKFPRMPRYFFYVFYPLHQAMLLWLASTLF